LQADLVLYNGDIHTMDTATPRAQAIAIAGNRVLAVGSDAEMRALLATKGEAVDLRGRTVVPGFTDAHLHFMSYGLSLKEIDLAEVPTLEEALARVAARAAETPAGHWLEGRGWDHSLWEGGAFPTRKDLDRVAPEHPVFLRRKCGHAGWANSRALELAGITSETADPPGGAIDREPATGQPTGILKERAMDFIFRLFEEPVMGEAVDAIKAGMANAHRLGVVGVHTIVLAASRSLPTVRWVRTRPTCSSPLLTIQTTMASQSPPLNTCERLWAKPVGPASRLSSTPSATGPTVRCWTP
jgi:predicted amidohydrolase YtcJ